MISNTRSAILRILVISLGLFPNLSFFAKCAMGQAKNPIPYLPPGVEIDLNDQTRGFAPNTRDNFYWDKDTHMWRNTKTGKAVGSYPVDRPGGSQCGRREIAVPTQTAKASPAPAAGAIDRCLVGTWRSESVVGASRKRGGSDILLNIKADGETTIDYSGMQAIEEVNPVTQEAINKISWSGTATGHVKTGKGLVTVSSVEKSELTGKETSKYGTRPASASGLGTVFLGGGKAPSPYSLNYACSDTALTIKPTIGDFAPMTYNFKREKKEP